MKATTGRGNLLLPDILATRRKTLAADMSTKRDLSGDGSQAMRLCAQSLLSQGRRFVGVPAFFYGGRRTSEVRDAL